MMIRQYKIGKVFKSALSFMLIVTVFCLMSAGTVYAGFREGATNLDTNRPVDDPVYYYEPVVDADGNVDYFHYPIYNDPQDITDEDFFGVWDENEKIWSSNPYFRYSAYPAMAEIEEAAKKGDYDSAKEKLFEYYKDVAPARVPILGSVTGNTAKTYQMMLDTMSRNVYACNFISGENMGVFQIPYTSSSNPDDWQEVSHDVTISVATAVKTYPQFNIMLCSVDKFYTQTEICSKESAYAPVLVVKANGVDIECPAVKDFTMKGGVYADMNFGSDPILTLEEHSGFQYSTDDTARSMIIFDLSAIPSDATIASATLKIRARTNQDRYPKEVAALWYKDTTFSEDTVNWNTVTDWLWWSYNDTEAWDYTTSNKANIKGKPGYHREVEPAYLMNGYARLTGSLKEAYAYNYIRHEMALTNGIGFSTDVMNSLDMSTYASSVTAGMIRCIESKYMTADAFVAILKNCWQMENWQVNSYFGTSDNNWATFASGSVYNLIARFPELSVHDEWLEKVRAEDKRVLGNATFADGMCVEQSVNYVKTILSTYETPVATSAATGDELPIDDETFGQIYETLKTLMYMQGPYSGFNQADGYDAYSDDTATFQKWYRYGYFNDDMLAYRATDGAEGKMPENPTTHYWAGFKTILRSGWGKNDTMLSFINNYTSRASHVHADALSFALFAYGKYLLTDQGYGSIQTGSMWSYNKSPVQHNVLTVNDIEDWLTDGTTDSLNTLVRGDGYELGFEANMQYDFIEYGTPLYTTSQNIQRSITYVRDANFFIVSDYAVPNNPQNDNLFAQHWHMYPGANFSYNENNYTIQSNFADDVNVKLVPVEYDEIDEIRRVGTYYSDSPGQMQNSEKAMVLKTKPGAGRFTTVIMPVNVGEDIDVEAKTIETSYDPDLVNAASILVRNNTAGTSNTYYYFHLNDESQKKSSVSLGEFSTDATTMLVQKNSAGDIVSAFMMNGSYIRNKNLPNGYIIKTEKPVKSVSFKLSGTNINIASTTMTDEDINGMTVYSFGTKGAYYQTGEWDVLCEMTGRTLSAKKQGGYLYFGENPVLDVEDESEDDKNGQTEGDRTGAVTGGGGGGIGGVSGGPADIKPPVDTNPDVSPAKTDYTDVLKTDWYYNDVRELSDNGIVSGNGNGAFEPNNKVTREQFLKMLLLATDTENVSGINVFDDVASDSWYAPYVMTARKIGIVNGITDTVFGVGTEITRQDTAVMIDRILRIINTEFNAEYTASESFADANEVSSYALDSVNAMKAIGLIKGYDNKFRPLDGITRAEAATVINGLYKYLHPEK